MRERERLRERIRERERENKRERESAREGLGETSGPQPKTSDTEFDLLLSHSASNHTVHLNLRLIAEPITAAFKRDV